MYGVSRLDYSRLRELKYVALRAHDRLDPARLRPRRPPRAARALDRAAVLPLPAVRARQGAAGRRAVGLRRRPHAAAGPRARHRARSCCWRWCRRCSSWPSPTSGPALVYIVVVLAVLFVAGTPWRHFAALGALGAVAIALVLVAAPAVGRRRAQALPGGPPHGVPQPLGRPGDAGLPAEPVADRDRRRREDRPRRRERHPDEAQLPARAPHRLHLRRGRRALRLRRRGARALALRAADMARAAHPHHREEPLRRADRRRHRRDAAVPGLRQRRDDHRDHADHRHPAAAAELRRLVGARHIPGRRPAAVDLRAGARRPRRARDGPPSSTQ